MARGRMISKSLGTSRKFHELHGSGKLAEFTQVLYVLLVAHSDDFGRQPGDAFTVKHAVFPTSPRSETEFETALKALNQVGLVRRYEVKEVDHETAVTYLQIVDFEQHQVGLHKRSESHFPEFPGKSGKIHNVPAQIEVEPNLTEPIGEESPPPPPSGGSPRRPSIALEGDWPSVRALVALYNAEAPDECPSVVSLSPKRIEKARRYLAQFPEREWWDVVCKQIVASRFLRGQTGNGTARKFIADFDWLLTTGKDGTENAVKVHDGRYQGTL